MDVNPFDEKDVNPEPADKNAPIALPFDEPNQQPQGVTPAKGDRVLWYTIGGITVSACIVMILIAFSLYNSLRSQVREVFEPPSTPHPIFTPRPAVTPNLTATQRAWVPPGEMPTFGSDKETKKAAEERSIYPLEAYADEQPFIPDIIQPGDLFIYSISIASNETALWEYGWCTTTTEILEQNFDQMKVEFVLNGKVVPNTLVAVTESQVQEGRYCRWLTTLITDWPRGDHQLEIRATFLLPTDDGWNVYPAGTHTFKYFVHVDN